MLIFPLSDVARQELEKEWSRLAKQLKKALVQMREKEEEEAPENEEEEEKQEKDAEEGGEKEDKPELIGNEDSVDMYVCDVL